MKDGTRIVKIYNESAVYEIDDENRTAYRIAAGQAAAIPYHVALEQIAGHRDERRYTYEVRVRPRAFYWVAGSLLAGVTGIYILWRLLGVILELLP